ncbi:MAG TPA: hypothetical protein DEP05_03445 [Betaproteobacteria bacterium]|nr:hypothetical protein [Betaproteobacteria bacterium]
MPDPVWRFQLMRDIAVGNEPEGRVSLQWIQRKQKLTRGSRRFAKAAWFLAFFLRSVVRFTVGWIEALGAKGIHGFMAV